jgi:hypothetical protein
MRRWLFAAVSLCALLPALPAAAQEESDEARFVRLTRELEKDPLKDEDKQIRSWMIQWLIDTPIVTVNVCNIAGLLDKPAPPNADLLSIQAMFGNGAYQIEHPGERSLPLTLQTAGVASALRSYEALVAADPKARFDTFERLLAAEKNGRLSRTLAPRFDEFCSNDATPPASGEAAN